MIQHPEPGEVMVHLPGVGSILELQQQIGPVFAGLLLRGRRARGQSDAIEWLLDGHECAGPDDPGVHELKERLVARCKEARELSDLLQRAIAKISRDATQVSLGSDIIARLGGNHKSTRLPIGEAAVLRDMLPRAAAAVERAVRRGNFAVREGQAKLFGWCFLPPEGVTPPPHNSDTLPARPPPEPRPPELQQPRGGLNDGLDGGNGVSPPPLPPVRLTLKHDQLPSNTELGFIDLLEWSASSQLQEVELLRVDGSEDESIRGPAQVSFDEMSDRWIFDGGQLPLGSEYQARGRSEQGEVRSNRIRIPYPARGPWAWLHDLWQRLGQSWLLWALLSLLGLALLALLLTMCVPKIGGGGPIGDRPMEPPVVDPTRPIIPPSTDGNVSPEGPATPPERIPAIW